MFCVSHEQATVEAFSVRFIVLVKIIIIFFSSADNSDSTEK